MSVYEKLTEHSDDDLPRNVSIKSIYKWKTEYNADSVEWCPIQGFENIFVCGNYHLIPSDSEAETEKERIGRILLFSVKPTQDDENGLKLESEIETSAVLDQKWCHHKINEKILLGIANSESQIEIYELKTKKNGFVTLEKFVSYKFPIFEFNDEKLILSLDWSSNKHITEEPEIICSDSKGGVHILKLTETGLQSKSSVIKFHEFETWIAGFYYWDPNIYFSGGDDCILYKYDQRSGSEPVSVNRCHQAGVTSLHSNKSRENILASGSYDEHVRVWDLRNFRSPLSSVKTPGPVWRVKWDPFVQKRLLIAAMLGGVHLLSLSDSNDVLNIVDSFYEHENIAYGVDWSFMKEGQVRNVTDANNKNDNSSANVMIASCSFYDNLLCVSKLKCDDDEL